MTDKSTGESAPVTDGATMRLTPVRHIAPWLIGFARLSAEIRRERKQAP